MTFPKIKILILAAFMLLLTINFWWLLSLFFKTTTVFHLAYLGISWLFFLSFGLLFFILVDSRNTIYTTFALGLGSFLLFFSFLGDRLLTGVYLISLLVFLLLLVIGYELILKEKKERLNLNLQKIWKRGLPFVILGLSLMIAVVYYFNPLLKFDQEEIEIPPQVFSFFLKPFSSLTSKVLPFYSPDMTIDEILTTGSMFEGGGGAPALGNISPELLKQIDLIDLENLDINQLLKDPLIGELLRQEMSQQTQKIDPAFLKQQRGNLEKTLGISLEGNETFDLVLAKIVNNTIKGFVGPYGKEISIGIAFALFFVLRLLGKILSFPIIMLSRLFFYALLLLKLITKEQVTRWGEVIRI